MARISGKESVTELLGEIGNEEVQLVEPGSLRESAVLNARMPMVYIIRCRNLYKIGHTHASIVHRMEALQIGNPYPLVLVFAIMSSNYKNLEKSLHKHFSHRHYRGEWFELMPEDEIEIESFLKTILKTKLWQDPQS